MEFAILCNTNGLTDFHGKSFYRKRLSLQSFHKFEINLTRRILQIFDMRSKTAVRYAHGIPISSTASLAVTDFITLFIWSCTYRPYPIMSTLLCEYHLKTP